MEIQIIGHNLEITPPLKDHANKKIERLKKYFNQIISIHVTLSVVKVNKKIEHQAKAHILLSKGEVFGESTTEDMYASIDTLIDKVDRQIIKHKEEMQKRGSE